MALQQIRYDDDNNNNNCLNLIHFHLASISDQNASKVKDEKLNRYLFTPLFEAFI
jgi:hypothetical protein